MILDNVEKLRKSDKCKCKCDICNKEYERKLKDLLNSRKNRDNKDCCQQCAYKLGAKSRPQNTKEFWENIERKRIHGDSLKNSEKYNESIKLRDISGEKNGMYGKKHSEETREKMSKARVKRIGELAPCWKGGKNSVYKRVRKHLTFLQWYKKVFERDNYICQKCFIRGGKLDAHHVKPLSIIVKDLLKEMNFETDDEKYLYLIEQMDVLDIKLNNGITLCRDCHKVVHNKWGSHNATAI